MLMGIKLLLKTNFGYGVRFFCCKTEKYGYLANISIVLIFKFSALKGMTMNDFRQQTDSNEAASLIGICFNVPAKCTTKLRKFTTYVKRKKNLQSIALKKKNWN